MKKKILIVDDDVDILEPISLILENEGYMVEAIEKGEETISRVDVFNPDLILLDILMSGSDGRTICKILKKKNKTTSIPIVLMSAKPGANVDAEQCGANDYIAKPFEITDLLQKIKVNLI